MIHLGRGDPSLALYERQIERLYEAYTKVGLIFPKLTFARQDLISFHHDGHLLTVAPTGAGKGVSSVIPTLLSFSGPVVVLDPKGENYVITSGYREKVLGHRIIKLDPFGVQPCNESSHDAGFNPLDIFDFSSKRLHGHRKYDYDSDAQMLASMLASQNTSAKEPFWDNGAKALLAALICYFGRYVPSNQRNLSSVLTFLKDPLIQSKMVDLSISPEISSRLVKEEFGYYGKMDSRAGWPGLQSTCSSYLSHFMSDSVAASLMRTSFDLADIYIGAPLTIYLVIPPEKLKSHSALLRLWIGTLLYVITSRSGKVYRERSLFILDECAQLGQFPLLEQGITICRTYGLQIWTFWQDLTQLAEFHGSGWPTIVNNSSVQQFFGCKNYSVAAEIGEMIGCHGQVFEKIGPDNQVLVIGGSMPTITKRLNYLSDAEFADRFVPNPYYDEYS